MNATFEKFGWPKTQIADLTHWGVMLRPEQPTMGSLVLACKQKVGAFGDVDAAGMQELGEATKQIERMLKQAVDYDKINYLMLMMVDPDVHFHVIPRHAGTRSLCDIERSDAGWPGPPNLGDALALEDADLSAIVLALREAWNGPASK